MIFKKREKERLIDRSMERWIEKYEKKKDTL